ncbi:MAG: DUF1992 domain-containing protein [Paenibacillus dendritiformis]|uniref:DnaJ family domain-containing protein n=1 Tax=Paenibacillus dendritiformis TaxID=130049 RepID=UPI001B1FAE7C|nr:DnaJ family domain-containing protein [Paenibacillus dendritiformis]MDU5144277.1 DUF1992 domain-containing protein [Paenibacillus dendritiformis]GIO73437.1 DUF1992 domain-containing protein [Paenibacillus dendritiformis]
MSILSWIAERKIEEAMEEGFFDDLQGKGKPLKLRDLSHVPEHLRAGYLLLDNAGLLPERQKLRQDIVRLESLLAACTDEEARDGIRRRLSERQVRLAKMSEDRGWAANEAYYRYEGRIRDKLSGSGRKKR